MSHSPLVLALTALGAAITAVVLPAGATPPGSTGKLLRVVAEGEANDH
jgi:hypothetical protein